MDVKGLGKVTSTVHVPTTIAHDILSLHLKRLKPTFATALTKLNEEKMKRAPQISAKSNRKRRALDGTRQRTLWIRHPETKEVFKMYAPYGWRYTFVPQLFRDLYVKIGKLSKHPSYPKLQSPHEYFEYYPLMPWYDLDSDKISVNHLSRVQETLYLAIMKSSKNAPVELKLHSHPYGARWMTHGSCMSCGATAVLKPNRTKYETYPVFNRSMDGQLTIRCRRCERHGKSYSDGARAYYNRSRRSFISSKEIEAYVRNCIDRTK